ncbi:ribosomal protein S6 kinase alpha-5-like, partial [Limulus polyphemus]|uniref:Ribosomal protein S6 kinase alpha-5-like n=1 Tax=Limulus polyphemus TaxID=6850 RepID=A0ABM1C1B0_LIMPO
NLLLASQSDEAEIKIVDFGFSCLKPLTSEQPMQTPCFTLNYAAPEVLKHAVAAPAGSGVGYDESCDLWSLGVILYTMLSGKAPFQSYSREASAATVMQRIREGEFSFSDSAWNMVSQQAKDVIKGLLTVNPQQRLTMSELRAQAWVLGQNRCSVTDTPLMAPGILSSLPSPRVADTALRATFDAFHMAACEGFRLLDVSAAPLAQRRRQKKSSTDIHTSSLSSSSSQGSLTNGPHTSSTSTQVSTPQKMADSTISYGFVPHRDNSVNSIDSVFTYPESKVTAYLSQFSFEADSSTDLGQQFVPTKRAYKHEDRSVVLSNHGPITRSKAKSQKRVSENDCIVLEEKKACSTDISYKQAKRPRLETIVID